MIHLFLLILTLPVFIYRLTAVTLSSWDEAWYASIARNIFYSHDLLNMVYNSNPFYDHPPFVMLIQSLCFKLFGISDFAVRFPSSLFGFLALIILYLIGKEIFGKWAGFFSALALITSPWFLLRSRTGNIDTVLTFLFLSTFYFALKAGKNKIYLIALSVSLGFLFLTKSLVPFTILPVIIYLLWKKVKLKSLLLPSLLFLLITLPWFIVNYFNTPDLLQKYLKIGYPGASAGTNIWQNILLTKMYIHNGMGNWFWWGTFSLCLGFLFYRRKYLPLVIFIVVFLLPFAFSNKGHIWHLIPLHPFWVLAFFGFIELAAKKFKVVLMLILFSVISWNQTKRNWYEIINVPNYKSDISILSIESSKFKDTLYLDDDSVPEAVWYSGKDRVERIARKGEIKELFDGDKEFLLITKDWRLNEEEISSNDYVKIAQDRDKILIKKLR